MEFSKIVGKTLKHIDKGDGERVTFDFDDGTAYASYHSQDCCESVSVQRIEGDNSQQTRQWLAIRGGCYANSRIKHDSTKTNHVSSRKTSCSGAD